jgi:hypothetical protein
VNDAKVINLTPHDIVLHDDDGAVTVYPPSGRVARIIEGVTPDVAFGEPLDQYRAGRIALTDGTVLEVGGTLNCVWAVTSVGGSPLLYDGVAGEVAWFENWIPVERAPDLTVREVAAIEARLHERRRA